MYYSIVPLYTVLYIPHYLLIVVMFIDSSDKYDIHIKYNNTI